MILQCDQCNTKFRLDDSKLKPGGVKVRCSKCRHVFVAGAEQKVEESDFDALLSGLGAQAPSQTEPGPDAAQTGTESALSDFDTETKPQQDDASGFSFEPEPAAAPAPKMEIDAGDLDFGDINIETGTPAGKETTAAEDARFDEFEFSEEPVAARQEAPAAPDLDFGDLSFDSAPAAATEEVSPSAAADTMDFGELSFDEISAAKEDVVPAAPAAADAFDFGDFSFDENPEPVKETPAAEAPGAAADFGEFSFDEEPKAKEEAAPAAAEAGDFGEFSFEEPAAAAKEEPAPAAAADSFDFGDFSFEETPAEAKAEPAPEPDTFSFEEAPAAEAPELSESASDFDLGQNPAVPQQPAPKQDEEFSFGEFSFSDEPKAGPASEGVPPAAVAAAGLAAGAALMGAAQTEAEKEPAPAPEATAKPAAKSSLDFSFGDKSFAGSVPEEGFDEDLPPLSITSRRKGRSVLTIVIVAICVVVVLALSGAGLYLLQSGPEAMKKLDQMGIGFVAKWFGMEVPEEGRITIKNPLASFHQNKEAGELFVVNGEAVNSFRKARASIQVKVSVFDKAGKVLLQKTAYCGNRLSAEQLSTLPMAKIESIMNNQFGDSLSNLGVKPDQSIGFVVAIANVPKEAADFGVEVVGSTVASGQ